MASSKVLEEQKKRYYNFIDYVMNWILQTLCLQRTAAFAGAIQLNLDVLNMGRFVVPTTSSSSNTYLFQRDRLCGFRDRQRIEKRQRFMSASATKWDFPWLHSTVSATCFPLLFQEKTQNCMSLCVGGEVHIFMGVADLKSCKFQHRFWWTTLNFTLLVEKDKVHTVLQSFPPRCLPRNHICGCVPMITRSSAF